MGFSGMRAVLMIVLLIALILAVTKFDLPGVILPIGLLAGGAALKGWENKRTA